MSRALVVIAAATLVAFGALASCTELKSASEPEDGPGDDASVDARSPRPRPTPSKDAGDDRAEPPETGPPAEYCPVADDAPKSLAYVTTANTVFDTVTGLMWERITRDSEVASLSAATAICQALGTGGFDDWRVPTRPELLSIVDYSLDLPKMSAVTFEQPYGYLVWTETPYATGKNAVWLVDFGYGSTLHYEDLTEDGGPPSVVPRLRCVRTVNAPCTADPRFVRSGAVVEDRITGLEWEAAGAAPRGGPEALAYCKALPGKADRPWRIPSNKEIDSLVVGTQATGYLPSAFPASSWPLYWTATRGTSAGIDQSFRLYVDQGVLAEQVINTNVASAVRCVR